MTTRASTERTPAQVVPPKEQLLSYFYSTVDR